MCLRRYFLLVALVSSVGVGSSVTAQTTNPMLSPTLTVFHDETVFLSASRAVSTETFDLIGELNERQVTGTYLTVMIDEVTYQTPKVTGFPDDGTCWSLSSELGDARPISQPNMLSSCGFNNPVEFSDVISFGENRSVAGIGFYVLASRVNLNSRLDRFIRVYESNGNVSEMLFEEPTLSTYYGFLSTTGIESLAVGDNVQIVNFGYDNVSRTAVVPEPTAPILIGILGIWAALGARPTRYTIT